MKQLLRISAAMLFVASLFPVGASCAEESDLARIKSGGKLVMLCFPTQDSLHVSVNTERGPMKQVGTTQDFKGLDVDLLAAFAEHLGVQLEIRPVRAASFDELIPALLSGEGDVIASSFSVTPERRHVVDFSRSYQTVTELVVTRKNSWISAARDLRRGIAAVIPGSSQEEQLRKLGLPASQLRFVEFSRDEVTLVAEGKADFTIIEGNGDVLMLADFKNLKVAFEILGSSEYAVAVRKGSDLKAKLDEFLSGLKRQGRLNELIVRWMPKR